MPSRCSAPLSIFVTSLPVQARQAADTSAPAGPPLQRTAEELYRAACATCHGSDGKGSPRSVVGFEAPLPDFSDCSFATGEPDPDWFAVVHEGGPVRALDRHMPAFGDALSPDEIRLAICHIRTFCTDPAWPQGDLNLPRAFFTEKAFPENEAVWTMAMTGRRERSFESALDLRAAARRAESDRAGGANQRVTRMPRATGAAVSATWRSPSSGPSMPSMPRGQISAAGLEVILPTGNESSGLGNGYTVFEPFAMWGQTLPRNSFLQLHAGVELPSDSNAAREAFVRSAIGTTLAADRGFGRALVAASRGAVGPARARARPNGTSFLSCR